MFEVDMWKTRIAYVGTCGWEAARISLAVLTNCRTGPAAKVEAPSEDN